MILGHRDGLRLLAGDGGVEGDGLQHGGGLHGQRRSSVQQVQPKSICIVFPMSTNCLRPVTRVAEKSRIRIHLQGNERNDFKKKSYWGLNLRQNALVMQ